MNDMSDICVMCGKTLVAGQMIIRQRGGDLIKHQVCHPDDLRANELRLKSLAPTSVTSPEGVR